MTTNAEHVHWESGRTGHIAWARTGTPVDLLLLHGYSDDRTCWDPVAAALAPRWNVLVLDARGHGESGLPDGPAGAPEQADDAAMVLDAQPLREGRTIVGGHSMGAGTAIASPSAALTSSGPPCSRTRCCARRRRSRPRRPSRRPRHCRRACSRCGR